MIRLIIRKILAFIRSVILIIKQLPLAIKISNEQSYYPEKRRKSYLGRLLDNIIWCFAYKEANKFYNLYGFDSCHSDLNGYIDYRNFMISRNIANNVNSVKSYIILLRDKFAFYQYCKMFGLPVPKVFGIIKNGVLYDESLNPLSFDSIKNKANYFLKSIDGECASFVKHIDNYDTFKSLSLNNNESYVLQEFVQQNEKMSQIYSKSVNTLRIVTINKNNQVYVLASLLRIGTSISGSVDNWAAGGIAVGIQSDGYLRKYGYFKPAFGVKTEVHPDSNILLAKFKIPFYQEALELVCSAHKVFYGIHSIGWDVAITSDGPILIEGNDNWEISLIQACDRPLKDDWLKSIQGIVK